MKLTYIDDCQSLHDDDKKVICVGRDVSILKEFYSDYKMNGRILCVINTNARDQKDIVLGDETISVCGEQYLIDNETSDYPIVIVDDFYRELFDELKTFSSLNNRDCVYYFLNKEARIEASYREKYKNTELKNIVVFRSGPHVTQYVEGMDFGDNAKALFDYMLSVGLNKSHKLVWFVYDPSKFVEYQKYANVEFISYLWSVSDVEEQRDKYYENLCLAKCFFFTDAYGFVRNCRSDQIRVQLWHGSGFKNRVNHVRCERRYDYMTVSGELYARYHADLFGLRDEQLVVTGNPKTDWVVNSDKDLLCQNFDVPSGKKYIYWLPTFRESRSGLGNLNEYSMGGTTGLPVVDTIEKMKELDELLFAKDEVLVIKLHPFQKREVVNIGNPKNIILIENDDLDKKMLNINQLLKGADAVISDYSSVAIDYLALDRPMGFLLNDLEAYDGSRGIALQPLRDYLPGEELYNFEDLCQFIEDISNDVDNSAPKRHLLMDEMQKYRDGCNSKRVVERFVLGNS